MLTAIEGIYRNGQIELKEAPVEVRDETPVIVTFMASVANDLRAHGISEAQAAELRVALAMFEAWNAPETKAYDDYDAAKENQSHANG